MISVNHNNNQNNIIAPRAQSGTDTLMVSNRSLPGLKPPQLEDNCAQYWKPSQLVWASEVTDLGLELTVISSLNQNNPNYILNICPYAHRLMCPHPPTPSRKVLFAAPGII